ncbi:NAD-dependent epimerase/dehydratase family protein [Sphingobacterium hungaricum]|uniref:Nucleoside-diphosphate-sugar epimerase n=1 Tax=Sphingobacterium hungaricum TaxID=2082723 RepID=A0A928YSD2_9SPHI|nr:NAD-dependent epimerase/dehydratase family protein [Sphingobacterium hungaricum]MBE8714118.1 nucleoside-diphosphate-sugar epimerase [Sphingobacterium hungaricum]
MHIIITGSSGFVGQNLEKYLLEGDVEVTRLSLREQSWRTRIDRQYDAIIHLAGKAHDTSNTSQPEDYFKVNTDLTIDLFNAFLSSEVGDFFYFSSVKAVADSVDGILTEDATGNPLTPYGKSKLQAEEYLLSKKLPEGKRLFIIRPCMIHGPGNKGNLNLLYQVVKKGIPWPLAAFHNQRSFLSIDNLNFLIVSMLKDGSIGSGVYNFADDEPISTNDLVKIIAETFGKQPRLLNIPSKLISAFVKIGDVLPLPLNSERLKKLTESYVVSNKKIKSVLRIEQLPLNSSDGLKVTIKSFDAI